MHNKEVPCLLSTFHCSESRAGPIYLSSSCPWPINLSSAIYSGQLNPAERLATSSDMSRQETRESGSNKTIKIATTSPVSTSLTSWWISSWKISYSSTKRQGGCFIRLSNLSIGNNSFYDHHLRRQIKCWHPFVIEISNYQYLMVYCAAFLGFYCTALCDVIKG